MQKNPFWIPWRQAFAVVTLLLLYPLAVPPAGAAGGAALAVAAATGDSGTETTLTIPPDLSPIEREALLARLSDEQVRELVQGLLTSAYPDGGRSDEHSLLEAVEAQAAEMQNNFSGMIAATPKMFGIIPFWITELIPDDGGIGTLFLIAFFFVVIFAAGYGAEWLARKATAGTTERLAAMSPEGFTARLGYAFLRLGLDALYLATFTAAVIGTFFIFYQGHTPVRYTVVLLVAAIFMLRLVKCFCRFLFAPSSSGLRVISLDQEAATSIHKGITRLTAFGSFAFLFGFLMFDLGYDQPAVMLYLFIIWTIFNFMLVAGIWRERETIAQLIRGSWSEALLEGRVRRSIARAWHYLAIAYVVFIWLTAMLSSLSGQESVLAAALGSLLLLVFLPLADAALYKIVEERTSRGLQKLPAAEPESLDTAAGDEDDEVSEAVAEGEPEPAAVIGIPSYGVATIRILRILLVLIAALVLAGLWGVNVFTLSAGGVGQKVTSSVVEMGVAVLIAYVAWEFIKRLIDRRVGPESGPALPGDEGGSHTGASRIQTLLPLIRKFTLAALVVMTGMLVLSSMGINIGPLIAGAGMIGLAVGFGAQSLVRDIIAGMFFLMDDAFRVGEYIDIGSVKGTVERISVRSLQMRHHNGPIHTVPYGEILYVTNYSRDWAIMKFELRIPFETDVDMVRRLIKKVGVAMMADEELGPLLLEPLKSQGVNRMDDSAFIVRCKFTALPGQQFYLRREAYARIQAAFEAKGVKFAPKRVIVETTSAEATPSTPAVAAAAAAAASELPLSSAPADDRG